MFSAFNWQQMTSAFIVLFAVIDIIGSIPIIINLKEKGKDVNALKATLISFALLIGFFYAGDMMLKLFHVDIESFAVAGAFVIFLMSLEMILDIEIFKNQGPIKEATLVPLVFPLLAGAGAFTTLLSLRAEYASINIIIALVLNMIWVYFVVSMTGRVERFLGKGGIYIIRKFFGIILILPVYMSKGLEFDTVLICWHYPVSNFSAFVYGKYFIAVGQLSSLVLLFFFLCRRNCNSFP